MSIHGDWPTRRHENTMELSTCTSTSRGRSHLRVRAPGTHHTAAERSTNPGWGRVRGRVRVGQSETLPAVSVQLSFCPVVTRTSAHPSSQSWHGLGFALVLRCSNPLILQSRAQGPRDKWVVGSWRSRAAAPPLHLLAPLSHCLEYALSHCPEYALPHCPEYDVSASRNPK